MLILFLKTLTFFNNVWYNKHHKIEVLGEKYGFCTFTYTHGI